MHLLGEGEMSRPGWLHVFVASNSCISIINSLNQMTIYQKDPWTVLFWEKQQYLIESEDVIVKHYNYSKTTYLHRIINDYLQNKLKCNLMVVQYLN